MQAKYVHTNMIAENWQKLAKFYTDVFGCKLVPPERDFQGDALDAGTGLKGAHLSGVQLRLPGHGESGPTIEIYNYDQLEPRPATAVNRPGFGHIAFEVENVEAARQEVEANGGGAVGEIVTLTTKAGTQVTWCYMTDPEGNVIELQSSTSAK
jgi:predicted enzyme related to lactoylglutathione lyase